MAETRLQAWRRRRTSALVHRGWARLRSAGAIAPGTDAADGFGAFGRDSLIAFPTATLFGESSIHIGAATLVGPWVTLSAGYPAQTDPPPRALVIGDRCVIGMRSGIVAHESIEIGDDVWFGQSIYVTDANHGDDDLATPIGQQLGEHRPVTIGDGAWIGHGAIILPGARIGAQSIVAAGSVVVGEVPDRTVVAGVPARVLRTRGDGETAPPRSPDGADDDRPTPTGADGYAFSRARVFEEP